MLKLLEAVLEGNVPASLDEFAREGGSADADGGSDAEVADYVQRHCAEPSNDCRALVVWQRSGPVPAGDVPTLG